MNLVEGGFGWEFERAWILRAFIRAGGACLIWHQPDNPGSALPALQPEVLGLEAREEALLRVPDLEGAHSERVALWPEDRQLGLRDGREYKHGVDVLVPHQSPHVLSGLRGRVLGQDELGETQEPGHPASVDVIWALSSECWEKYVYQCWYLSLFCSHF